MRVEPKVVPVAETPKRNRTSGEDGTDSFSALLAALSNLNAEKIPVQEHGTGERETAELKISLANLLNDGGSVEELLSAYGKAVAAGVDEQTPESADILGELVEALMSNEGALAVPALDDADKGLQGFGLGEIDDIENYAGALLGTSPSDLMFYTEISDIESVDQKTDDSDEGHGQINLELLPKGPQSPDDVVPTLGQDNAVVGQNGAPALVESTTPQIVDSSTTISQGQSKVQADETPVEPEAIVPQDMAPSTQLRSPTMPPLSSTSIATLRAEVVSFSQTPTRQELILDLTPPDYGQVSVRAQLDQSGRAIITLIVASSAVRDALLPQLPASTENVVVTLYTREEYVELDLRRQQQEGQSERENKRSKRIRDQDESEVEFVV